MSFIDIQVNGYAGVDFNSDPLNESQIQVIEDKLKEHKVKAILPTVITGDVGMMAKRLSTLRRLIDQSKTLRKLMPAFHIEGPCISPVEGYRGAHQPQYIIPATPEVFKPLIDACGGLQHVCMVTLAPEVDKDLATTRWLTEQGIWVCIGHSDAPRKLLLEAEQAGVKSYTHLGNGSANMMHRHDNIITRVLSLQKIKYSIILDGHHVPFWLATQFLKIAGFNRCLFTTDCSSAAASPPGYNPWDRTEVDRSGPTPVVRLKGTPYLAGAACTMQDIQRNALKELGLSKAQVKALTYDHAAKWFKKWIHV